MAGRTGGVGLERVVMEGGRGTSGTALVPSKERGESIDLCDPSDVEDVNTKRDQCIEMTSCHILLSLHIGRCIVCGSEDEYIPLASG